MIVGIGLIGVSFFGALSILFMFNDKRVIDFCQNHSQRCVIEFDGASKGNPGRSGAGVVIRNEDGGVVSRAREGLGHATNNVAEYKEGLNRGLETALSKGYTDVVVKTDSQLIKNQGFNSDADAQASQAANLPPGEVQYNHGDDYYDDSDDDYY